MKNLLFISPYPFPLDKGSNQHAYFFLKSLIPNFNVYCIFFIAPEDKHLQIDENLFISDKNVKKTEIIEIHDFDKGPIFFSKIKSILSFPGSSVCRCTKNEVLKKIWAIIRERSIEIIHIEQFNFSKYAFNLSGNFKKVIVYHDLHHRIYLQQARFQYSWRSTFLSFITGIKYYFYEKILEYKIDLKVFLNPNEMEFLPNNSVYIPHIVNSEIVYRKPRKTNDFNFLFIGGYNHPPNRISVDYIIEKIVPSLKTKMKSFQFHIVGAGTEKFFEKIDRLKLSTKIKIHGFVKDINKVFEEMDIGIFPILYGGGIKTKILDSMAAGLPIITTPEGIQGLHNLPENCIGIGSGVEEIVSQIMVLSDDFNLQINRSINGKKYIEREHSFAVFSNKIYETYSKL